MATPKAKVGLYSSLVLLREEYFVCYDNGLSQNLRAD